MSEKPSDSRITKGMTATTVNATMAGTAGQMPRPDRSCPAAPRPATTPAAGVRGSWQSSGSVHRAKIRVEHGEAYSRAFRDVKRTLLCSNGRHAGDAGSLDRAHDGEDVCGEARSLFRLDGAPECRGLWCVCADCRASMVIGRSWRTGNLFLRHKSLPACAQSKSNQVKVVVFVS